ncbi:hypothetical protein ACQSSU_04390 [Micromonospora echinospora]
MATRPPLVSDQPQDDAPTAPRRHRLAALRRPSGIVLTSLVAAYVLARLFLLARGVPYRAFDSGSYAGRLDQSDPTATLSFTGRSPRLWGTPLLYSLADSDRTRIVLQTLVAITAWVVLVVALWVCLRSLLPRVVMAVALFGLALTPPVYLWDHALLSEALSINLGLLAAGLLVLWLRTGSRVALVAMTASTVWWIFTRQDVLVFVGILLLVLAGLAWRSRERRRLALASLAVLLVALAGNAVILDRTDRAFQKWSASGLPQTEETFLYRLTAQIMDDPKMRATYYEELGMPVCPGVEMVGSRVRYQISSMRNAYQNCPDLVAWADKYKFSSGYRYALADPGHYLATTGRILPEALNGPLPNAYGTTVPMLPAPVRSVYFPARDLVLPLGAAVALLAVVLGGWGGAWRRRRWLMAAGVVLIPVSLVSVLASLMFSAGEYSRFGIQEAIYLRIALVLLVVAVVDAALDRRAEKAHQDLP